MKKKTKAETEEQPANIDENLDDMLKQEGINISDGDTTENIMSMFKAGFSIIEISKVIGLGVEEVKNVIDANQGE